MSRNHAFLTSAFHPEQEEHGDDGQEGPDGVGDDELERVVVGDEQDVEDGRGREVAGQQAARVGQDCLGVDHAQTEEGDRPNAVEHLERSGKKEALFNLGALIEY